MILASAAPAAGAFLLDLLVVLVAAKLAAEVAERVGIPPVVGEILAGMAVGPSALGLVEGGEVLAVVGELGVILLLLQVGMEMDLGELGAVGRTSLLVAVLGVVLPFAGGWAVASALGHEGNTAIFVGAALTATSVGITARVFGDLRALSTVEARTVLGAAVADDVLGLVILTVVVRVVSEGSVSLLGVAGVLGLATAFLVVVGAAALRLAPPLFGLVARRSRSTGTVVCLALAFALAVAGLASAAKLAAVVGAFLAGLALGRAPTAERIRRDLTPVGHLLVPVFFLGIGVDLDVGQLARPSVLGLAGALLVVAVAGKLGAALGVLGSPGDKLLIGLGMLPRGEVGLIFAGLGLREGVLGGDLYAALLLVVLGTTLVAPPILRARLLSLRRARRPAGAPTAPPLGGWLQREDGVTDLRAVPPPHLALHVALDAARMVADSRPGPELLDWFGGLGLGAGDAEHQPLPLPWDARATSQLLEILRHGTARSWRFLETTGILDRVLPELAETFRRRRADASELDPAQVLRWALVDEVHRLSLPVADPVVRAEHDQLEHPEWLLLAALVLDAAGEDEPSVPAARQLAMRLDLGAAAEEEIALLVGESGLLRAAAKRPEGLDEERVVELATHLERPERARALYLLTLAQGGLEPWERERLGQLHGLVQEVLRRPELTGREARNVAEQRRAAALRLVSSPLVRDRLAHAPRPWLLSQDSEDLVAQSTLLEPLPGRYEPRVAVAAGGARLWRVDVAARDQPGLLARVTGVLDAAGLDVVAAGAATWPDGGVVETFRVRSPAPPDPAELEAAIAIALRGPFSSTPVLDAEVRFDDEGSPWHTLCEVEAPDRAGLLHAVASAFAASGVSVHSARVETREGRAVDLFAVTDARSQKLDGAAKAAFCEALTSGVRTSRRGRGAPRTVGTRTKQRGHEAETPVP